jgi:subtilisin family serine protease
MANPVRVMIQLRSTPALAAAAFGPVRAAPEVSVAGLPGVLLDAQFPPVPIPPKPIRGAALSRAGFAAAFRAAEQSTYVVRATVAQETLARFIQKSKVDPQVVGVFSDPKIQPVAVCPSGPVGTDIDVEELLLVEEWKRRGLDGTGVTVVIVDTGINLSYLNGRGKRPGFDRSLSWGPAPGLSLGDMPVDHGTMCAYDVCIAAPGCTLVDHALLTSTTTGGSVMDGFLSDAVQSYGVMLSWMAKAASPFAGDQTPRTLVANNSWGMFHPSWDFPVGDPGNYSDNPDHPFNIIVGSLEAAGADILFAAGNCGPECPDRRCEGVTDGGIYGANSSPGVTCVAGVVKTKERIGYSTTEPGRLEKNKPDIASFTHFAGSGVYAADGGTSAATPVATGVVAAIRRLYPSSLLPPAKLRDMLRGTAKPGGANKFDHEYGYGVLDVRGLLDALDKLPAPGRQRPCDASRDRAPARAACASETSSEARLQPAIAQVEEGHSRIGHAVGAAGVPRSARKEGMGAAVE